MTLLALYSTSSCAWRRYKGQPARKVGDYEMNFKKSILSLFTLGVVTILAVVSTNAFFNDTETSTGNILQAGSLDLKIDSEAHYAGMVCSLGGLWEEDAVGPTNNTRPELLGTACEGTWELKDLIAGDAFFSILDVKPGDSGENTISIHVDDNDAWLCADLTLAENDDNSSTEPELEDGDVADVPGDEFDGELAENVSFTAWIDQGATPGWQGDEDEGEGDNVWQGDEDEPLLFTNVSGPASDVLGGTTYALADSTTGFGPISGDVTNYLGLQWCHGVMTVDTTADTISCDGSTLDNTTQTDSFSANVVFRAEQARNNSGFRCDTPATPPAISPIVDEAV